MKKAFSILIIIGSVLFMAACSEDDPITDLGETSGDYYPYLSLNYSTSSPALGDTLTLTATTFHRNDNIASVVFSETIVEKFGITLTLNSGTSIATYDESNPTLIVTDSIKTASPWLSIDNSTGDLDAYYVTESNYYAVSTLYLFQVEEGAYDNNENMINQLSDEAFDIIKSLLAYAITKTDYISLFPDATDADFTSSGTYVLNSSGMENLKENLTRDQLIAITSSLNKEGTYSVTIDVEASALSGVYSSESQTFESEL